MSYKELQVWQLAREISIEIHQMSLESPRFELYETGSQIRRSSKSIRSNIVDGYGRRRFKKDFIRFLIYAQSSVDETRDHLETLHETGSLKDQVVFKNILGKLNVLGRKPYKFIEGVENQHKEL